VTASDALVCLKGATGQSVALACPCDGATSTATSSTSTTTTSTTTLSPAAAGQALYDSICSVCHRAGSYDTDGFAPNLAKKGNLVVQNLGSINSQMSPYVLTKDEVAAVRAFLNSL